MAQTNEDIKFLIEEIESIRSNLDDEVKLKSFISDNADSLISLLLELEQKRETVSSWRASMIKRNVHRTVVEGYSEDNIHEAFSMALGKVSAYFSEDHDVSVTVIGLVDLPKGGYRATLEVQRTPVKLSLTKHVKETNPRTKKKLEQEESLRLKQHEDYYLQHLVLEHFVHNSEASPSIPDFLFLHIHEADILKRMVQKGFFQASHTHELAMEHIPKSRVIVKGPKLSIEED